MSFVGLINNLEQLQKAQQLGGGPGDEGDEVDAGGAGEGDGSGEGEGEGSGDDAGAGGEAELGKAFSMTLEDGTVIEAVDGSALVKSLLAKHEALVARVVDGEQDLAKALGVAVAVMREQGALIKSLQERVAVIGGEGRGRRATVTVNQPPANTPAAADGMRPAEFLAKCESAMVAGRLSGREVAIVESRINNGVEVPAEIVSKVLG